MSITFTPIVLQKTDGYQPGVISNDERTWYCEEVFATKEEAMDIAKEHCWRLAAELSEKYAKGFKPSPDKP